MNTLQSLHGHLSDFHFLIFLRKIGSVAQSLMLEETKFQILGPRYKKKCSLFNSLSIDKVSMSHLISFSRYQTKCVIKFLFRQLMTS